MNYEEPYRRKRRRRRSRRRERSFGAWLIEGLLRLVALAFILALLAAGALYALPVSLFAVEPDDAQLSLTDGLPESRLNVLLLGLDALRESRQRSDSVLVASVGYGPAKLVSVMTSL